MTTIVAVKTAQHIVIGSDSQLSQGETRLADTYNLSQKIYTVGNSCIGLSGSVSHYTALIQALQSLGDDCDLRGYDAIFSTFTKVHKKLKDDFFLNPKKHQDDPYEGNHISAMVANGSGIYGVYAQREVLAFDRFWANGSGRTYSLGAMFAAWHQAGDSGQQPDALGVARMGLAAGMEFDKASGGAMRLFRFKAGEDSPAQSH
jgi:ATP-dependent HslUV protease subunit HslV